MKKILVLTSNFPKILDNGSKLRDYHIMKYLARKHELWAVGFNESNLLQKDLFLPFIPAERCFTVGETRDADLSTLMRLRSMPLWALIYYAEELQELLDSIMAKIRFDYIYAFHSYMAHYISKYKNIIRVIDHHNVKTNFYADAYSKTKNVLKKIDYYAEYYKWFNYEREILTDFEFHTACSEHDQTAIKRFAKAPVELLPSGVDGGHFYPKQEPSIGLNLLFTGSLEYFPNYEGVAFFVKKILPRIRRAIPNVVFQVVGRKPSDSLEKMLRNTPNVWFSCDVKDMRPFYYQSTLFVVPLLDGGGTRLKIMEAMAAGLPVVSTSKGSEGLDLKHGEGIWVVDEPDEFADSIISLLNNHAIREDLRLKAVSIIRERYDWDKTLTSLDRIFQ